MAVAISQRFVWAFGICDNSGCVWWYEIVRNLSLARFHNRCQQDNLGRASLGTHNMSATKRGLVQALKTPVAILQYLQGVLNDNDYHDVQDCMFEYDRYFKKIVHDTKKSSSQSALYTKTCSAIFADLHAVLVLHCEFMHALYKLLDVSRLVDASLADTSDPVDQHETHEHTTYVQQKIDRLQRDIGAMAVCLQKHVRDDKEEIIDTNSQLRFALNYKTLARILHLARGNDERDVLEDNSDVTQHDDKHTKTPDLLVHDVITGSNAYEAVKNQCMLGAVLKYTERSKTRLETQRKSTSIGGVCAHTVLSLMALETDLVKNTISMLRTTQSRDNMKIEINKTLGNTRAENTLLQTELDSVLSKIQHMQK